MFSIIWLQLFSQDTLNVFKKTVENHGKIWESTWKPKQYNYKLLIPLATATGVSIGFEQHINKELRQFSGKHNLNTISGYLSLPGDPYILGSSAILLYGSGWLFKDQKLRHTAVMATEAYGHTAVFTLLGKLLFARQRPYVNGKDQWHFFPSSFQNTGTSPTDLHSFPSAHTSGVFALATVLAKQYQNTGWVPPVAYTIAGLTGLSRITGNEHWLSDVIAGAALGYANGYFVVERDRNTQFTLFPAYWDNKILLTMQLKL
ncbi:MAG: phosphatase PAP2 family protein [Bacteroidales bacterium]